MLLEAFSRSKIMKRNLERNYMMQTLKKPVLAKNVFLASGSIVRGDVTLMEDVNVWFHAVIRAEAGSVVIGSGTNIQDGCVIHVDQGADVAIGSQTTIGHNATIHGCTIGNNTLIGMGAIIMNHAVIGDNCIVAAGALVPQNTVVPDNSLVMSPQKKFPTTCKMPPTISQKLQSMPRQNNIFSCKNTALQKILFYKNTLGFGQTDYSKD